MKQYTWLLAIAALAALVMGAVAVRAQNGAVDAPAVVADATPDPVQLVSLSIDLPRPADVDGNLSNEGVSLTFLATLPDMNIIEVDEDNYTLTAFTDDTGKVLLSPDPDKRDFFDGLSTPYSQDAGPGIVEFSFRTSAVPAPGATSLTIQATVPVLVGSGDGEVASEGTLVVGQSFTLGDYTITLGGIEVSEWQDGVISVTFNSSDGFMAVKTMTFTDAKGSTLDSDEGSWSKSTFNGQTSYVQSYDVTTTLDTPMSLTIEYFTEIDTVEMEIDKTFGIGLGPIE